jgi:hypothetical protein
MQSGIWPFPPHDGQEPDTQPEKAMSVKKVTSKPEGKIDPQLSQNAGTFTFISPRYRSLSVQKDFRGICQVRQHKSLRLPFLQETTSTGAPQLKAEP